MNEILKWSAVKTAAQIANKSISVAEVTRAHLDRAQEINPQINAFTELAEDEAMRTATAMDSGRPATLPAGFGVPMSSKSNVDQTGYANSNGVPAFAGNICTEDSGVVANMKRGGGVIIGRTNTPEFSLRWCTSNPLHGVSLNPWDHTITPGGSSGAAAASVAMGAGCIAHGNDLGGSLRYPAYCCGVATIRPSNGRVPAFNPSAPTERPALAQSMSVNGPIARSIGDVRLGLHIMSQRDSRDPNWLAAPHRTRQSKDNITIGYCLDPFGDGVGAGVETAVQHAITAARTAGIPVREVMPPNATRVAEIWGELLFTETRYTADAIMRQTGSREMIQLLDTYYGETRQLDLPGLLATMAERSTLQRQWGAMFNDIDILLMPTSGRAPFANDLDFTTPTENPALIRDQRFLFIINALQLPSASIPTHLENGIPMGVQLVAPMHEDFFALDVAEKLERHLGRIVEGV